MEFSQKKLFYYLKRPIHFIKRINKAFRRNVIRDIETIFYILKIIIFRPNKLIYNLDHSPSTFGDFTYAIALANAMTYRNNFELIITYSDKLIKNKKWFYIKKNKFEKNVQNLHNFALHLKKNINSSNKVKVKLVKDFSEKNINYGDYPSYYIIPRVIKFIRSYPYLSKKLKLGPFTFRSNEKKIIKDLSKYICLVIRRDPRKLNWINTNSSFLKKCIKKIRKKTDVTIVIVSDKNGCKYAKGILKDDKNIRFSYNYGGINESVTILLQSDYIIQKAAGGICVSYIFSDIPYFLASGYGNLIFFYKGGSNRKKRQDQIYEDGYKDTMDDKLFLNKMNLHINKYASHIINS